jgi:very-short-patch-repair endonuclease
MTEAEKKLWRHLRGRGLDGFKFRRQAPLGPYVLDFFCEQSRLVVEVDGGLHADRAKEDRARAAWLKSRRCTVIRVWNNDVLDNTEGVLAAIRAALPAAPRPARTASTPTSPLGTGGSARDLASWHEPLTDLFRGGAGARLSEAQRVAYEDHGFVTGIPLLNAEQVEALRAEIDAFWAPDHEGRAFWYEYRANAADDPKRRLLHASGQWRVRPGFHDLIFHPAIASLARQLLGGAPRLLHDQLFCKPARHGGIVAWHQDYSYWTYSQPMAHATFWIALDDATIENGCLHYVPGSHRWGLLPITGLTEAMESIEAVLSAEQRRAFKPVPVELPAGHMAIHHPLMVHGSYANDSARPRRATVINVMRDGARAAVEEPEVGGVPAWLVGTTKDVPFYAPGPKGPPLGGRYFPLL